MQSRWACGWWRNTALDAFKRRRRSGASRHPQRPAHRPGGQRRYGRMTRSAVGRRRIGGHTEKDPTTARYALSACEPADPYSRLKCDLEPPRESVQQSPLLVCCTQTTSPTYRPYPACPPAPSAVSPVSCISPYYYCTAPFADAPAVTLDLDPRERPLQPPRQCRCILHHLTPQPRTRRPLAASLICLIRHRVFDSQC